MTEISRQQLITEDLPSLSEIKERARQVSKDWTIGRSPFMDAYGVNSEWEYKERCKKEGRIMRHAHIGYNSADQTIEAIKRIYEELDKAGYRLDRFGICLDCQMGVPAEQRDLIPRGAGLVFDSPDQWIEIAQAVPVMVHFGDNMIGTLNSLENLRCAFAAGGTTIGNASHYYTYEYLFPYDLNKRTIDTVTGFAIMAQYKDRGMLVHSNLDDGFASLFHDVTSSLGWAKLETYIVSDLLGARLGHCFGNLYSDPALRIAFSFALDDVHGNDSCGSMIYGNTTDFQQDFRKNHAVISGYLLGDLIGQIHRPTGHALNAVPVSEAARIPSPEEIMDAQIMSNELERYARLAEPYYNWDRITALEQKLVTGADVFFDRTLEGLDSMGIDIKNPAELMLSMKKLGPAYLEEHFGAGMMTDKGRKPVWPTDMTRRISRIREESLQKISKDSLDGTTAVVSSTDVHEFGKEVVKDVLTTAGAKVYDLGTDVSPEEIAETAVETDAAYICVSTYNGIALTFARRLLEVLSKNQVSCPVFMGGMLNENQENGSLPVDVTGKLKDLGVICTKTADEIVDVMKRLNQQAKA